MKSTDYDYVSTNNALLQTAMYEMETTIHDPELHLIPTLIFLALKFFLFCDQAIYTSKREEVWRIKSR